MKIIAFVLISFFSYSLYSQTTFLYDQNGNQTEKNTQNTMPALALVSGTIYRNKPDTLILDPGGGFDTYLWHDNSTQQTFDVDNFGLHTVILTYSSCVDTLNIQVQEADSTLIPVSINELELFGSLVVYPNPSNGNFTIELSGVNSNNTELQIYHSSGVLVKKQKLGHINGNLRKHLNLNTHAKGIYFVILRCDEKMYKNKLIIN